MRRRRWCIWERSLTRSHPGDSIVRKLYALVVQGRRALGQTREALEACARGRAHYPDDVELLFHEALLRREFGDLPGAKVCLEVLLAPRTGNHFASIDSSLTGYKAYHNLAVVCQELGEFERAKAAWRAAGAARPGHVDATVGLAELLVSQRCWEELEPVLATLEGSAATADVAGQLRARALQRRGGAAGM